jgi:hypothetical protein
MFRTALTLISIAFAGCNFAYAGAVEKVALPNEQGSVYVQIIVKACRPAETPLEPTNHGKVYDDEKPMTLAERKAMWVELGCVDVPIPMEWLSQEMTPAACKGHAGYIASMQFLEQRQDLADHRAVGAWQCVLSRSRIAGVASQ